MSQVRRINTACNKLEPQLDAEARAAKRKAAEKEGDQKRDRSGRARPAEERAKQQRLEMQQRHLYNLDPMWSLPGSWSESSSHSRFLSVRTFSPKRQHVDNQNQASAASTSAVGLAAVGRGLTDWSFSQSACQTRKLCALLLAPVRLSTHRFHHGSKGKMA